MSEVEKVIGLVEKALDKQDAYNLHIEESRRPEAKRALEQCEALQKEIRTSIEALAAERDRLSTEIDLVSWSFGETPPDVIAKAKAKAQAQQEPTCKQDLQVEAEVQQPRRVTGQQIAEGLNKALAGAKAQVQQEPQEALFLLHTGKFYDGEQDEWEIEADSYNTVSAFCHAHPEQTIGLYAAPVNDKLRAAAQVQQEPQYKAMFESAVSALAEIDRVLGIEDDGCNSPQQTIATLKERLQDTQVQQDQKCLTCNGHGLIGGFVNADNGYEAQACPDCNAKAQVQQEPLDRGEAVNLATNFLREKPNQMIVTDTGVRMLCNAIIAMDSELSRRYAAPVTQVQQEPMSPKSVSGTPQEPVGSVYINRSRGVNGLVKFDFDYWGDLPEGSYRFYAAPVNCDKLREAAQKALDVLRGEVEPVPGGLLAYDGAIESLVEALEAMK